jgi:hypothetical protein
MKNKLYTREHERELRKIDKIDRILYDEKMANNLINLAIRLQQKEIINHLGEKIE